MKKILIIASAIAVALIILAASYSPAIELDPQKRRKAAAEPEVITTNPDGKGIEIIVDFRKGRAHNYPVMAIWIEDMDGNFIQNLYVVQSIATSTFRHGRAGWGHWEPAVIRRPAALPYWGHQRGIKAEDGLYLPTPENPVPDAYSGATPQSDFILLSRSDEKLYTEFRVLLEINQPWDWNNYWHNNKFHDDPDYKTSSQPALVYEAVVDTRTGQKEFEMKPIGHSHYSGKDGSLIKDLSTITTALDIANRIVVRIP